MFKMNNMSLYKCTSINLQNKNLLCEMISIQSIHFSKISLKKINVFIVLKISMQNTSLHWRTR